MKFAPKSQSEIDAAGLLPAGIYDFEIAKAEDAISKKGNDMIHLVVRLFAPTGETGVANDYLMEALAYKLRHAAEACGLLAKYESGSLDAADFEGKTGRCKVKIEKSEGFPDKNAIGDYIPGAAAAPSPPRAPARQLAPAGGGMGHLDDEIPFAPPWE